MVCTHGEIWKNKDKNENRVSLWNTMVDDSYKSKIQTIQAKSNGFVCHKNHNIFTGASGLLFSGNVQKCSLSNWNESLEYNALFYYIQYNFIEPFHFSFLSLVQFKMSLVLLWFCSSIKSLCVVACDWITLKLFNRFQSRDFIVFFFFFWLIMCVFVVFFIIFFSFLILIFCYRRY